MPDIGEDSGVDQRSMVGLSSFALCPLLMMRPTVTGSRSGTRMIPLNCHPPRTECPWPVGLREIVHAAEYDWFGASRADRDFSSLNCVSATIDAETRASGRPHPACSDRWSGGAASMGSGRFPGEMRSSPAASSARRACILDEITSERMSYLLLLATAFAEEVCVLARQRG